MEEEEEEGEVGGVLERRRKLEACGPNQGAPVYFTGQQAAEI